MTFGNDIARAWMEYGRSYAKHCSLWDGSNVLSTIGPQPVHPTKTYDLSGRNNHGTLTSGPTWENGSLRGQTFTGLKFAGNYGQFADRDLSPGTGDMTISCWVRPDALPSATTFVYNNYDVTSNNAAALFINASNVLSAVFRDSATQEVRPTNATPLVAGQWYFVAGIKAGKSAYVIVNATTGTVVTNGSMGAVDVSGGGLPTIAAYSLNLAANQLTGAIAGLTIHRRVLTPNEIAIPARHPLEAYRVNVPRYWMFAQTAGFRGPLIGSRVIRTKPSPLFIRGA